MKCHQWSLYQYLPSMELQDTQENLIPQKGMGNRRSLFYQMKSIHLYQPIKAVKLKLITQVHFTVIREGKKLGPTINRHLPPLCWAAVNYKCHSHVYIASHCSITEINLIEDPLPVTTRLSMQELIVTGSDPFQGSIDWGGSPSSCIVCKTLSEGTKSPKS